MKSKRPITEAVKQTVLKNKGLSGLLVLFVAGSVFAGILPPLALERIVNALAEGKSFSPSLVLIYFLLFSASGILDAGKESLITVFGQKATHQIRSCMCRKLKMLPADYYTGQDTGTTVSRFVNDVDTVEALFTSGVISMAADAFRMLSILAVIFLKSPGLGILLLLVLPFLYLMTRIFQKRMLAAQLDNRIAVGRANNHVPDTIRNIRMIHNLHKESYMEGRYDSYIQDGFKAVNRANFYDAVYSPIIITVSSVLVALMMILSAKGGWLMQLFGMSVGTAVAVISYVGKIFDPLESIGMEIQNIQAAAAGIHRINEFLEEPEMPLVSDLPAKEERQSVTDIPALQLKNVTFGYEDAQEILHEFSLTVRQGEHVTLSGRTGAGKSTVFKLLLGLYEPWSGAVNVFGQRADQIGENDRRKIFGYVEQGFHPVPGTILDQITLGDTNLCREQVIQALDTAGLLDAVQELPKQLDTPYSAALFSQGQIQLLSIARAIAADPKILLLDEVTANLDSNTEQRVLEALQAAARSRTVLSISHRLYECAGGRRVEL
ncbi:ABC transporter ATP-binding protein [Clostridium sp. chh4-2]|uniref:ABC transporter ATP-binding protein n=1 Tax=Clostridium sp. chh4-2 TaxID=2067550 RepID=UPI001FA8BEDA|nr:ABC transporter ATP-binding protein [Clostridium sp. chh4-2]